MANNKSKKKVKSQYQLLIIDSETLIVENLIASNTLNYSSNGKIIKNRADYVSKKVAVDIGYTYDADEDSFSAPEEEEETSETTE